MSLCDSIQFYKCKNAILFYMRKTENNYFFWRLIEQDLATSQLEGAKSCFGCITASKWSSEHLTEYIDYQSRLVTLNLNLCHLLFNGQNDCDAKKIHYCRNYIWLLFLIFLLFILSRRNVQYATVRKGLGISKSYWVRYSARNDLTGKKQKNTVIPLVIKHKSYFWLISGRQIISATTKIMMKGQHEVSLHYGLSAFSVYCSHAQIRLEVIIQHNRKFFLFSVLAADRFTTDEISVKDHSQVMCRVKIQSAVIIIQKADGYFTIFTSGGQQGERPWCDGWQTIQC